MRKTLVLITAVVTAAILSMWDSGAAALGVGTVAVLAAGALVAAVALAVKLLAGRTRADTPDNVAA